MSNANYHENRGPEQPWKPRKRPGIIFMLLALLGVFIALSALVAVGPAVAWRVLSVTLLVLLVWSKARGWAGRRE